MQPVVLQLKPGVDNNTIEENSSIATGTVVTNLEEVLEGQTQALVADLDHVFSVGDIVWSHISGYPMWPSIVTPFEEEYTKTASKFSRFVFMNDNHCMFSLFQREENVNLCSSMLHFLETESTNGFLRRACSFSMELRMNY